MRVVERDGVTVLVEDREKERRQGMIVTAIVLLGVAGAFIGLAALTGERSIATGAALFGCPIVVVMTLVLGRTIRVELDWVAASVTVRRTWWGLQTSARRHNLGERGIFVSTARQLRLDPRAVNRVIGITIGGPLTALTAGPRLSEYPAVAVDRPALLAETADGAVAVLVAFTSEQSLLQTLAHVAALAD